MYDAMENKCQAILTILFLFVFSNQLFTKDTKETKNSQEVDADYEEFKALRKKEQEAKKAKEKEQEYLDYVEFQEFKKRKSAETIEEQEIEKKRKEGKVAYSPWAVQYIGASGIVFDSNFKNGNFSQFLVAAEYHEPSSKFGFRLGLAGWTYNFASKIQNIERDYFSVFFLSRGNILPFLIYEPYFSRNSKISGNSLDFHLDYHFKPRQFVDPYVFAGSGIGVCESECNVIKLFVGAGIRVNIKAGYFLSEFMIDKPFFAISESDRFSTNPNLFQTGFRIGFGIFL